MEAAAPASAPKGSLAALEMLIAPSDLSVVFQPIVWADTLEIFAYEALLRCGVPAFSNPTALLARAARDKCIGRLGRLAREVAMPLCEGRPVFVNVHPLELEDRWIVQPDDPLYSHDHEVFIEINESAPMTHLALCQSVLKELKTRAGINLVVDDLGGGYSNLSRIADLEPAFVKLDRSLLEGIEKRVRSRKLVTGIVRLCADMGAQVIAEGVESREMFMALRECGVHMMQGFFLAKPAFPLPELEPGVDLLARWRRR